MWRPLKRHRPSAGSPAVLFASRSLPERAFEKRMDLRPGIFSGRFPVAALVGFIHESMARTRIDRHGYFFPCLLQSRLELTHALRRDAQIVLPEESEDGAVDFHDGGCVRYEPSIANHACCQIRNIQCGFQRIPAAQDRK